ncbi:DUF441 domain-containing protein [Shouchella clausii]|uniref:UPF0756 membrane protein ABC2716 n=3 Tax=Shouchella TaxID=2893057 RepID=Y2716_SHOC1|nr:MULTISPECIES: DUF441 domain-containing protein [Shouchella]Q5WEF9.1 RecName: Full=UPF0756 membrane protein ABC2716 [Shouchella clausii KSM-K16]MCM3313449.1 DUF441 domain-containing protein [Psychrobacillus sp. MER TA 17]PAD42560.1 hypothetical protein CHH54_11560 [Bacillus sp. 7520-S]SPU21919.1 putative membrane spanning protein [Niallia circulans]ALA54362.1 putative membrane protein [Shouchella clausii]AST97011.1 hypothetical protein BC8716_14055 [Shouchella clausii]
MLSQSTLFLLLLMAIALIAKNQSLIIAISVLLLIKWTGLGDKVFPLMQAKGINLGVTIITIAVLVPIATGDIGFKQLGEATKSLYAWVALGSGIAVALVAASGIDLLKNDPHITAALVLGTIVAVSFLNGVAVGPLIGAGIAYLTMRAIQYIAQLWG